MTFHGTARAPAEVMEHVHELPQVMLVPLYVLAAGALFAGIAFSGMFIGGGADELLEERARRWPSEAARPAFWIVRLPTVMMAIGVGVAVWFYLLRSARAARARPSATTGFTASCSTSGTSTSSTTSSSCGSAKWLGRFLWKKGDGWLIDGFGPDGVSARVLDVTAARRAPAIGLPLPLRFRHADRRRARWSPG